MAKLVIFIKEINNLHVNNAEFEQKKSRFSSETRFFERYQGAEGDYSSPMRISSILMAETGILVPGPKIAATPAL